MVVNRKRHRSTPNDVYIGRPSKWGNPFAIGVQGSRSEVIQKYSDWVQTQPHLMASLHELKGKTLVCWCKPEPCHGDVLEILANADADHNFTTGQVLLGRDRG